MKWRGKFVWKTFLVSSNCNLRVWKHTFFTNFCLTEEENFYNRWRRKGRKRECENVTFWSIEGLRFGKKGRKREERKKQLSQKWNYFIFFFFSFQLLYCSSAKLYIILKATHCKFYCALKKYRINDTFVRSKKRNRGFFFSFPFSSPLPPPRLGLIPNDRTIEGTRDFSFFFFRNSKKKKKKNARSE